MSQILPILVLVLMSFSSLGFSKEASFTIQGPQSKMTFTRSELLARKQDLETIHIPKDPSYFKATTYTAIRITKLFENLQIPRESVLQFKALDGFSAPISLDRLLNSDKHKALAYLAIEPNDNAWPPLKSGSPTSAGPFYLVWQNPEASQIANEEWPYQLVSFEVLSSLAKTYPDIFPDAKLGENSPEQKGFVLFRTNCFTCHTMNKNGASQVGPDLNVPMSPTEYFSDQILKAYIRNPQAIRHWPEAKMKPFTKEMLTDQQVDDLLSYFKHMKTRKTKI